MPVPQPPTAPALCRPPCAAQGDGQGQEGRARRRIRGGAGHVNAEEAQGGGPLRRWLGGRGVGSGSGGGAPGARGDTGPLSCPEPWSEVCRSGTGFSIGEREFQHHSLTGMDVDFFVSFTGLFLP